MKLDKSIEEVLAKKFDNKSADMLDVSLDELPLDSMDLVDLICDFEDLFNIEVNNFQDIDMSQSLGSFISHLKTT